MYKHTLAVCVTHAMSLGCLSGLWCKGGDRVFQTVAAPNRQKLTEITSTKHQSVRSSSRCTAPCLSSPRHGPRARLLPPHGPPVPCDRCHGALCTGQGATQALRGQTLHQDLRLWPSPDSTVPTAIDAHSCGTAPATSPQQRGQCWRARGRPDTHVTGSSPGPEPKSARQWSCESFLTKREAPVGDGPTAPRLSLGMSAR